MLFQVLNAARELGRTRHFPTLSDSMQNNRHMFIIMTLLGVIVGRLKFDDAYQCLGVFGGYKGAKRRQNIQQEHWLLLCRSKPGCHQGPSRPGLRASGYQASKLRYWTSRNCYLQYRVHGRLWDSEEIPEGRWKYKNTTPEG